MLEKPGMKHKKSRGIFGLIVIKTWGSPLQASLRPHLEGYQMMIPFQYSVAWRGSHLWFAGRPLEGVELELETSVSVLAEMNQVGLRLYVITCLLAAKKLRGNCTLQCCSSTTAQNDEEMDFEDLLAVASDIGNNLVHGNHLDPSHHDSRFFEASNLTSLPLRSSHCIFPKHILLLSN
mmetsp:Transcript_35441/g.57804  ORF Transcript_35441/g.57804 Transcript_35441/m.57804 type:complete len:178 (+) Transcript_35441:145-678(+)